MFDLMKEFIFFNFNVEPSDLSTSLLRVHSTYPVHKFVVEPVVEVGELRRAFLQGKSKEMISFTFILYLGDSCVFLFIQ